MQKQRKQNEYSIPAFDRVRDRLYCRLIDPRRYVDMPEKTPRETWEDLAIISYVEMDTEEDRIHTLPVTQAILEQWNVEEEEVFRIARENTHTRATTVRNLEDVLGIAYPEEEHTPLYVMTKEPSLFGAVCIAEEDSLQKAAEVVGESYYIIPSSIHEVLILPESGVDGVEELNKIVCHINDTEVSYHEVLTDHVYRYGPSGLSR